MPHKRARLCSGLWLGIALLSAAMPAMAEVAETIVRIYPTATVTADEVMLTDVAALSGQGAELAARWAITAAPAAGHETTLDQDAIQQALIRKGINPSSWVFRGASRCRISRPMPLRSHESTADQKPGKQISSALQASGESGQNVDPIDTRTLDGALRAHVFERLASLGGKPVIQVSPAMRDLMQLARPEYDFAIADRGDRMLGLVQFDVTIYRQGKVEQVRPVLAEVALVKPVVMAAGPINRGQTIQSKDVVIQDQTFDRPDRVGMTDLNAVVGQRAVRFMNKGEMLTAKEIEPVPFVVRNDLVTVTARRGSVTIKGVAKALSSASYGNTVELRNESSKQVFLATVTGPKTAELVMSGTMPAQAVAAAGGNQ